MAKNNPQQPYPSDPNDPNATNPYRDQPLAEPFNDRPAGHDPSRSGNAEPRFPSDLPEFQPGQTPQTPRFPSDMPEYQRNDAPDTPAGYSHRTPTDPTAGYSQPVDPSAGQDQPRDPSAGRFHNPQYEWAQGNQQSYPSGGARMIRWLVPIAIVAMVVIYWMTRG